MDKNIFKKAWASYEAGRHHKSVALFEEALKSAKVGMERDRLLSAYCYPLTALKYYSKARRIYTSLFKKYRDHKYLHQIGMVEREAGNYRKALEIYKAERRMIDKSAALPLAANLYELGKNNELLGRKALAARYAKACIAMSMRCRDFVMKGCAFRLAGDVQAHVAPRAALLSYAKAGKCFKQARDKAGVRGIRVLVKDICKELAGHRRRFSAALTAGRQTVENGFYENGKFYPACDYKKTKKTQISLSNGLNLWIEEEGKGHPLIALHGGPGGSHLYFHPGLSPLAKHRRVVCYDMRGQYMSSVPKNKAHYGLLYDADDLEELRKALKIRKFDLLGHSYGGMVALIYALKYPHSLNSIIFCSTPIGWTERDRDMFCRNNPDCVKWEKKWAAAKTSEEKNRLYHEMSYQKPPDKITKKYNELSRSAYYTKKYARSMPAYEKDKTKPDWRKLKKIKVPMLAVFGANDWNVRPDNALKLTCNLKNMRLRIIPGAKHDIFSDKPEEFAAVIEEFLAG